MPTGPSRASIKLGRIGFGDIIEDLFLSGMIDFETVTEKLTQNWGTISG
jgi:hypothetical protein